MSYVESSVAFKQSTVLDWQRGWEAIAKRQLWFFLLLTLGVLAMSCTPAPSPW
jgi:hypothetical protein